ncbi:MAG: cyclophilin-like fold protein [Eubacteriales bacterium]|nr:cyclophilin-like fold protein [Eubacteriales bacterium]
MTRRILIVILALNLICTLAACGTTGQQDTGTLDVSENSSYESVEGTQIKMITENTEVIITLNDSRAAADLVVMLPLELTLIERNSFAKGMTLPEHLSSVEATTREYEIGDFGYWNAGPDLAIFYDDIYEQTIVEVIPLGHAETGAETMANEAGTVRLELLGAEEEQTENE